MTQPHQLLHTWADLHNRYTQSRLRRRCNWQPVTRLIDAVRPYLEQQCQQLVELLERSNEALAPLGDPLLTDFGAHRFLRSGREESYTDWLAWILEQLDDPALVLEVLAVNTEAPEGRPTITCELWVPEGHEGQTGRLDLVLRWPGQLLVVVEVKMTSEESADTGKQAGYARWVEDQSEP